MKKKDLEKEVKRKNESRQIVDVILNHGITSSQKIDIMYFLALTLEDNQQMKEIGAFLKKYVTKISEKTESKIKTKPKKILLN